MAWDRPVGYSPSAMVAPALVAGIAGPPVLYLVLRRLGFARSIAVLLGAMLAVATTHVVYSTRVKSYTADLLLVLILAIVVPWLAGRTWRLGTAVAWFAGAVLISSFSPFSVVAAGAAGVILVLHPHEDRRLRLAAVTGQFLAAAVQLAVVTRTYNARPVNGFWFKRDAFIEFDANPVRLVHEVGLHLVRVTAVFPGGGRWWAGLALVVAIGALIWSAWRGSNAVLARFLILVAVLAFLGAAVHRFPFGPDPSGGGGRVTLWLVPVVAVALAAALEWVRRSVAPNTALQTSFDVVALGIAAILVIGAFGDNEDDYPTGARAATRQVIAELGPTDAVWITWSTTYAFALDAETRVELVATPRRSVGFFPRFADPRIRPVPVDPTPAQLDQLAAGADCVFVVHADIGGGADRKTLADLGVELSNRGFVRERSERLDSGRIEVWSAADRDGAAR